MELSVKTLDSHTHNFSDLDAEITVLEFKSHISSTVTLPPEQQRLIFRGRVLQDDKKLKDYNVTSGQVVHLVARNPTSSSTSNDHPPQPQPNTAGGGGGAPVAASTLIMGTLEFQNGDPSVGGPPVRRRNAAAVRLTVANRSLTSASDLLHTLEEDVALLHPQNGNRDDGETEDVGMMEVIGRHHAAATAAVVASLQPRTSAQVEIRGGTGGGAVPTIGVTNQEGPRAPTPSPMSVESENGNSETGTANAGNSARPEAPMLHELATSLNDVLALNTRLAPYLQTVQRWLTENGDLNENQASVQYTYNAVSSILHSIAHSLHALSDITVDFTLPPGQRRLRAPTSVWVEQSAVMRAAIPVGLHIGVEMGPVGPNSNVQNPNAQNPPTNGGPPGPQFVTQGTLPPGAGQMQFQQAISNLIQGVMSGQIQQQQQHQQPLPPQSPLAPQGAYTVYPNLASRPVQTVHPTMINQLDGLFGSGNGGIQIHAVPAPPPSANNQTGQNGTSGNITTTSSRVPGGLLTAISMGPPPQPQPPPSNIHHPMAPAPPAFPLHSFVGARPRMEQVVLQCQSHHYAANATLPPRPQNLESFLREQSAIPAGEEAAVFDTFVSMLQGLNIVHPIINQYIRGSILRGRDINNPGHVTTGIRVYARRFVDWIVGSIAASTGREFDSAGLTARLLEVVTTIMSKVTQTICTAPSGSAITPALGSLLNEWMPSLLSALESTFPPPGHLRILKGIILLIATTCFPTTSVVFRTHLTAGIAQYLINCQPTPADPSPEPGHGMEHFEGELAMEIDVEFEGVAGMGNQLDAGTTTDEPEVPPSINPPIITSSSSLPNAAIPPPPSQGPTRDALVGTSPSSSDEGDEDGEGLESQFRSMANDLFRDLPREWHPTLLNDLQRQESLRTETPDQPPSFSPGFSSLFPQK